MEPLNGSFHSHASFENDPARVETAEPTMGIESTGRFGIGPKKLAKFADTDGAHESPVGRDEHKERKLSAKLFVEAGGYDGISELIKTDMSTGIDPSSLSER